LIFIIKGRRKDLTVDLEDRKRTLERALRGPRLLFY